LEIGDGLVHISGPESAPTVTLRQLFEEDILVKLIVNGESSGMGGLILRESILTKEIVDDALDIYAMMPWPFLQEVLTYDRE
jgi:hypothetical protein